MKLLSKKLLTKIKNREDVLIIMQINDWCNSNDKNHKKCYEAEGYFWTKGFTQQELAKTLDIPLRSLQRCLNRITSYDESNFIVKRQKLVESKNGNKKTELWYRPNYPYICNRIGQELPLQNESESQTANLAATARIDVPPPPKVAESYKEESFINLLPSSLVSSSNPKTEKNKPVKLSAKQAIPLALDELTPEDVMIKLDESECHPTNHIRLFESFLAYKKKKNATPKPLATWQAEIKRYCKKGNDELDMGWKNPQTQQHLSSVPDAQATRQQIENEHKECYA